MSRSQALIEFRVFGPGTGFFSLPFSHLIAFPNTLWDAEQDG
jgi:hypothetical protein